MPSSGGWLTLTQVAIPTLYFFFFTRTFAIRRDEYSYEEQKGQTEFGCVDGRRMLDARPIDQHHPHGAHRPTRSSIPVPSSTRSFTLYGAATFGFDATALDAD
ncbi:hypothetical protein D9756_008159 [Leucocoprinus leucothites]|uniref:Uncharacterized protein n=1 Tax=Leucocoprinus leucothites TaxID=201217 RepID=A0A8H5D1N6_9AGAR|nr:hypothetical protein D9756_008159 [Leucoagaricus leucothites]